MLSTISLLLKQLSLLDGLLLLQPLSGHTHNNGTRTSLQNNVVKFLYLL